MPKQKLHPGAAAILRSPWKFNDDQIDWASKEAELCERNVCPQQLEECRRFGCVYPGKCGSVK